jgi:hypothetical protein
MSEEKKALKTMGMTQSEFGAAIIEEAQSRKQKQMLNQSVAEAATILTSIDDCNTQIAYFTGWKQTREGQLDALQKGEFTLDPQGAITYNTAELNRK